MARRNCNIAARRNMGNQSATAVVGMDCRQLDGMRRGIAKLGEVKNPTLPLGILIAVTST
jgi:hypothetical protein